MDTTTQFSKAPAPIDAYAYIDIPQQFGLADAPLWATDELPQVVFVVRGFEIARREVDDEHEAWTVAMYLESHTSTCPADAAGALAWYDRTMAAYEARPVVTL